MLKYLRLPLVFDIELMRRETLALAAGFWKPHYNTMNYEGGWSALPLYALSGNATSIHATHAATGTQYRPTPLLERCPYLQSLLNTLEFPKRAVRLMRLEPGAVIKEHSDIQLAYEEGGVRLHLPVQTNSLVEFHLDGERVILNEGELWYLNLSLPHRVSNLGATDRIHLVIDGEVNAWLREQFARPDALMRKDYEPPKPCYDAETRRRMIEEFEAMGTPTALQLAASLKE
jgi:quercetin dioxygenase-like cupin family protein